MKILGIETSCDETASAIYDSEKGILSNVLFSQIEFHKTYGGVVPEIASRSHLEKIRAIVDNAIQTAPINLNEIYAIAVTNRPGLPGSLLVGLAFAKGLAWATNKKIIGINHLEGHIYSACIENNIPFPFLCLTASGGHTALYLVNDFYNYQLLGQTLDDAAGEAFDKVAKLINLPYPGGPIIEKLASEVNFVDFFHYPRSMPNSLDFSFSGLKTAVLYDLIKKGLYDPKLKIFKNDRDLYLKQEISSSFLVTVADIFERKLTLAFNQLSNIKAVAFVGGVACNKYISRKLNELCLKHNKFFFKPSAQYCTDNGAMIAFVGCHKALAGQFDDFTLDIY